MNVVYILKSNINGRFYIGSTNNLERRLVQHNSGKVKATKYIKPLELQVYIVCQNLKEARQAEYRLKKYKKKEIIQKTINDKQFPWLT